MAKTPTSPQAQDRPTQDAIIRQTVDQIRQSDRDERQTGGPAKEATLRDWFAAHAPEPSDAQMSQMATKLADRWGGGTVTNFDVRAAYRYAYADAMLKQRKFYQ